MYVFKVCKSVHHRTIQINHKPDATIFQFIIPTFVYTSTCFRRFSAHHQELNDCSGSLWFYLRIVVAVVLCSWSGQPARTRGLSLSLTHTRTRARTHTHTRTHTHARAHTHTHTRAHTHTRTRARTHARTHTRTHAHTHTRARAHTHTHTHTYGVTGKIFNTLLVHTDLDWHHPELFVVPFFPP